MGNSQTNPQSAKNPPTEGVDKQPTAEPLPDAVSKKGTMGLGNQISQFLRLLYRQWWADQCGLRAGALTFTTMLSLVPLTAVSIALLEATGHTRGEDVLVHFISRHVMPMESDSIATYVRDFARNIKVKALGAVGVTLTLGISYFLFDSMEAAFNDIWRAQERRPLIRKFTVFWALATLGPFILALSIVQGTHMLQQFTAVWMLVPFLGTWALLILANRLLPHTRVGWKAAIVAGFVSALVFEAAKYGFSLYFTKVAFTNYTTIYGRLAMIPTLLVWIGTSWSAVLIGVETGYILQNKTLVEIRHRQRAFDDPNTGWAAWVNGNVGARVMLAIATWYKTGKGAIKARPLALSLNVPEEAIIEILRRLRAADLIVEVTGDTEGHLPNRPLDDITLGDVWALFEQPDTAPQVSEGGLLDQSFKKLREFKETDLGKTHFEALAKSELTPPQNQTKPKSKGIVKNGSSDSSSSK